MSISHADYCSKVCGAKCCFKKHKNLEVRCPKLAYGSNLCLCYEERFDAKMDDLVYIGTVQINKSEKVDFICARIKTLIRADALPDDIAAGCCYVHPQLLKAKL